jgi:hypothetical protein
MRFAAREKWSLLIIVDCSEIRGTHQNQAATDHKSFGRTSLASDQSAVETTYVAI